MCIRFRHIILGVLKEISELKIRETRIGTAKWNKDMTKAVEEKA